jgi:hypothetical protein
MTQTYYVGLDVHKETISIAHALHGRFLQEIKSFKTSIQR